MSQCRFEKVFIIGCGKISATVLEFCASLRFDYDFELFYVKNEKAENTATEGICEKYGINEFIIYEKKELTEFLNRIFEQALIISAGNYYLFPQSIVQKENLEIINFHYALLPRHKGRNAPSWVIYANEKESGATWHYVDSSVDGGDIIWQGRCTVLPDDKAWQLIKKIMDTAQKGIEKFLPELLIRKPQCVKQEQVCLELHLSKDIPGEGFFDLNDNPLYIYALLRSLDFGSIYPLGHAKTVLENGKIVQVKKYKRIELSSKKMPEESKGILFIKFDEETALMIKYEEVSKSRVLGINLSNEDIAKLGETYTDIDFSNLLFDNQIEFESDEYDSLKEKIDSEDVLILVTNKNSFNFVSRLAWGCKSVRKCVVIESMESFQIEAENTRCVIKVWDMVAAGSRGV